MFYCVAILLTYSAFTVPVFNIFVAYYSVCSARSFAAVIKLAVSTSVPPLDSHRNSSCSPISCLPTYTSNITSIYDFIFSFLSLRFPPYFPPTCLTSLTISLLSDVWFNSTTTFDDIVELLLGRFFSWLLTVFRNRSSLHFSFRHSAVLIIHAL